MAQALYRKYRPRSLAEVVGQAPIIETLTKALKSGRVRHAYLFSGPKGVGKTSVARILAHAVNQLPYKDDSVHLDIIEIDAASNRRIDEVRQLREKLNITPVEAKYKVYIIDEVHMLTREAFNALLKTLEEPPAHCIFILATTEAHKLPETIISRTQHFRFKPLTNDQLEAHLASIAKQEKFSVTPEAIKLVANYEHGSVRDSLSLLDRLGSGGGKITDKSVMELIGMAPADLIEQLVSAIESGRVQAALTILDQLQELGANPIITTKQLSENLRNRLADGKAGDWATSLLRSLLEIPNSPDPQQLLEICVLEAASRRIDESASNDSTVEESNHLDIKKTESATAGGPAKELEPKPGVAHFKIEDWPTVLDLARKSEPGLYTALRLAEPELDEGALVLKFEFSLHQKKIDNLEDRQKLARLISQVSGGAPVIKSLVEKRPASSATENESTPDNQLKDISNIFDGAEVLES